MNIEILTPSGFQKFDGIKRSWHKESLKFIFDDNSCISTTLEHVFILDGKEAFAKDIIIGNNIGKVVKNIIKENNDGEWFYDPLNVDNGHLYYHDNYITSHNCFLGNGDTLIDGEHLLKMSAQKPLYDKGSTRVYQEPIKGHDYIMSVDVAQGRGQDYSTFNIIDVSSRPFRQVATYRNNKISPILFPAELIKWAKVYNDAYMIVENNDQGALVTNGLHYDFEWEEMFHESTVQGGRLGLRMTRKTKKVGCSNLKDLIEENKLEIVDEETIKELSTFEARGTSFEASRGNHDDMVMSLVSFAWFTTEMNFLDLTDTDVKSMMYAEKMRQINDDHVPFGFIDDGIVSPEQPVYEKLGGEMWAIDKGDDW